MRLPIVSVESREIPMTSGPITWGGTLGENPAAGTAATIVGKSHSYYPRSGRRCRSDWRRNAYEPRKEGGCKPPSWAGARAMLFAYERPLCANIGPSTNCHALVVRVDTGRDRTMSI